MRRITLWLMSTVAALVLLFSYRTSTGSTLGGGAAPAAPGDTATGAAAPAAGTNSQNGAQNGAQDGAQNGGSGTYQGSVADTRWGPVQVTITVANGKITSVAVPTYPNNNGRDRQINARALPVLKRETIKAQSADIDTVSGATVTSDGYRESLQAALDAAHR
jgi:uncharacterized protein with FMN-binding domain